MNQYCFFFFETLFWYLFLPPLEFGSEIIIKQISYELYKQQNRSYDIYMQKYKRKLKLARFFLFN